MDASSWRRVKETVQAALARPPAERAAFIVHSCGDHSELRVEVDSLLAAIDQAGSFIERPAVHSSQVPAIMADGWGLDDRRRALEPGHSLGAYTILEFVGAGGMGEVYRARDSKIGRAHV